MKKILFVLNHFRYSNGVATALLNLIKNMPIEKYDIHILAIYEFDYEYAKPIIDRITVVPGINYYFHGLDRLVRLIPGRLLYNHFVKEHYDLEIAFQFGVATIMIAEGDNPNKICWMHGYDTNMQLRRYYEQFKQIISVSEIGRDKLMRDGFQQSQVDYCYNIIDEDRINKLSQEEIEIVHDKTVIISVGRLSPEKGFQRYVECINKIGSLHEKAEFWIIGDGTERESLERVIKENHMESFVKLLGMKKNPYKYMKCSDLYFCTSFSEGFSTTCQEAAILGIPVVSVDVDGANELIKLAECGAVIDNSADAIMDELMFLLSDEHIITEWKTTAQRNKKRFHKNERVKKAEKIINEALDDRSPFKV